MLDAKEIDLAIAELEYKESSFPNYAKLANLYTIRNQMNGAQTPIATYEQSYSAAKSVVSDVVGRYGSSDFLRLVDGKDAADAWEIMDGLMDTLHTVNPRVYDSVMRKLETI